MKQNKADIKRESFEDHPMQGNARQHVELAASALTPWEHEHEASAVVHFYKKRGTNSYAFICQLVGLDTIPEGQADVGWKELQKALMKVYGREDKRRTDTKEEII